MPMNPRLLRPIATASIPIAEARDGADEIIAPTDYVDANGKKWRAHIFNANGTLTFSRGGQVEYLIVAGGGGGGSVAAGVGEGAGGGGAGGLLSGTFAPTTGAHSISVGAGGSGASGRDEGANGSNSSAFGLTAIGGGGGGGANTGLPGNNGGSGGGGGRGTANAGLGTADQGFDGGDGESGPSTGTRNGGGGGGAGALGQTASGAAGDGGDGLSSSISGFLLFYAGGGAGGGGQSTASGGKGGGGASAANGTANTGGGGGGAAEGVDSSGSGGSGVVIVRYPRITGASTLNPEAQDWVARVYANGGTVSTSTANAVSTFCNAIDAAGIRDRFYRLNLFAGTGLNAALVPLYRGPTYGGTQYGNTTDTNNGPFVSGDYSESVGLTSDSSSKFLRTGMNMSDLDTVETGHMSVCYGGLVSAQENLLGATSAAPLDRYTIQFNNATDTLGYWGSNTAAQATGGSAVSADGMATITRRSATDLEYYENATSKATSAVSVTPAVDGIEVYIFRTNSSTASFPAYTDRIRGYSIGRSVTSGQVADFYAAMKTFQDALGRTQT